MEDCVCRTCDKHGKDLFCHGKCPDYIEYDRKWKEYLDKRYKEKLKEQTLTEIRFDGIHRMIKKGKRGIMRGNFYPTEGTYPWMTKNPERPMTISNRGKVWVINESDIPKAKDMIRAAYKDKLKEFRGSSEAVIRNFENVVTT